MVIPKHKGLAILTLLKDGVEICFRRLNKLSFKGVIKLNLKQEIGNSKALIKKYQNQIESCYSENLKESLQNKLKQEQIKLEGYELLLELYKKVGYLNE